jgi:hypothetical protein
MNASRMLSIGIVICCFISCQGNKENSNVELTKFTKELISLYINDTENLDANKRKDEIIIISVADSSYYYLSVFANNSKSHKFCREDFIGETTYSGYLIRLFGDKDSIFFFARGEDKRQKKCKQDRNIYDPTVWQVCFHKDTSFCKMKTYKNMPNEDISAIQRLAEKYFRVSNVH